MAVTLEELENFSEFAKAKISEASELLTLERLWDLWRLEHPTQQEHDENVAAVRAAIRDMENGDHGVPAEDHIRELRGQYGPPPRP